MVLLIITPIVALIMVRSVGRIAARIYFASAVCGSAETSAAWRRWGCFLMMAHR